MTNYAHRVVLCFMLGILSWAGVIAQNGELKIRFHNMANNKPVVLMDSSYETHAGEQYTIKKLKYYVTHITLSESKKSFIENESYHLVQAGGKDSIVLSLPEGTYQRFQFLLGVDSIRNTSGAQTGALDPLNDMFWTWNSGYVNFKLEGQSPASKADRNRIEHHIGGFKDPYKTSMWINIDLPALVIKPGELQEIFIVMNLDKYWDGMHKTSITGIPVITLPGEAAKKQSENFSQMFSLQKL